MDRTQAYAVSSASLALFISQRLFFLLLTLPHLWWIRHGHSLYGLPDLLDNRGKFSRFLVSGDLEDHLPFPLSFVKRGDLDIHSVHRVM